jgi:hypothetical protein
VQDLGVVWNCIPNNISKKNIFLFKIIYLFIFELKKLKNNNYNTVQPPLNSIIHESKDL